MSIPAIKAVKLCYGCRRGFGAPKRRTAVGRFAAAPPTVRALGGRHGERPKSGRGNERICAPGKRAGDGGGGHLLQFPEKGYFILSVERQRVWRQYERLCREERRRHARLRTKTGPSEGFSGRAADSGGVHAVPVLGAERTNEKPRRSLHAVGRGRDEQDHQALRPF